jgi:hypothetical protein
MGTLVTGTAIAAPGIPPGHGEPDFCEGVRPPGTDSLCPITGLTPP